jgi:hypothetical protein
MTLNTEKTSDLIGAVASLKDKLSLQLSFPAILSIVQRFPCPARAKEELVSPIRTVVDPLYSVRHRFLQKWLVDALELRLKEEGYRVRMVAEARSPFGTGDLDIRVTGTTVEVVTDKVLIREEVKGGNFEYDQLVRYLFDCDHVVVTLGARGTAFKLSREDVGNLVGPLEALYVKKMDILSKDGDLDRIPGRDWCRGCTVACPHATTEYKHTLDIQKEIVGPSDQWASAIAEAVTLTLALLGRTRETCVEVTAQ